MLMRRVEPMEVIVNKILMTVVMLGITSGAYAADFSELQTLKASDIKAVSSEVPVPLSMEAKAMSDEVFGKLVDGALEKGAINRKRGTKTGADLAFDKLVSDTLRGLPGDTPFEKVKALFNKGVPATKEDLFGWHTGRTFRNDGAIMGALLVMKMVPEAADGGPLFSTPTKVVLYVVGNSVPAYYDEITPAVKAAVERDMTSEWTIQFPEAIASPRNSDGFTLEERKSDGYVVERFVRKSDGVELYTYYFKNVTPKE